MATPAIVGGSRATRGKITVSVTAYLLNYCVNFRVGYVCTFYKSDRRLKTHRAYRPSVRT